MMPGCRDPVIGVLPGRVDAFQWHYYTFELPADAELLARSDGRAAGLPVGRAHLGAIQFHAEVTRHMLDRWFTEGEAELPDPAAVRERTNVLLGRWNEHGRRLCGAFLDRAAGTGLPSSR